MKVSCSGEPDWIGDNYCDDENNNLECNWDGGDCCGDNVNTQYCTDCDCLEGDKGSGDEGSGDEGSGDEGSGDSDNCEGFAYYIGDGSCDDENNNLECNWDGGDCCGDNVMAQYCLVCGCLYPGAGDSGRPTTTTMTPPNHGFGFPGNTGF